MSTGKKIAHRKWEQMKKSSGFRNTVTLLIFVCIAALFWFIMALNDNVTRTIDVKLRISNIPDTVTFINAPPESFHVTVRDKGTNLLRSGMMRSRVMNVNFRDYASNDLFRFSHNDLYSELKSAFGTTASFTSTSIDSIVLTYTTSKGKLVPVRVNASLTTSAGFVLMGDPKSEPSRVRVYSNKNIIDTLTCVYTNKILRRNLSESTEMEMALQPITGCRIIPDVVKVKIGVEPLVRKDAFAAIIANNVPVGKNLVFFPGKAPVTFYVPMSKFNDAEGLFEASVEYEDIFKTNGDKIAVRLTTVPGFAINAKLAVDSVEYSLINE